MAQQQQQSEGVDELDMEIRDPNEINRHIKVCKVQ
jgi:hypothetical protein